MNYEEIQSIFDFFLLSTLAEEPMRCSDLELRIEKKTRGVFKNQIHFSKALERLESAGWLKAEQKDSNPEKVYSVTAAGKEQLESESKRKLAALAQFIEGGKWPAYRFKAYPNSSN